MKTIFPAILLTLGLLLAPTVIHTFNTAAPTGIAHTEFGLGRISGSRAELSVLDPAYLPGFDNDNNTIRTYSGKHLGGEDGNDNMWVSVVVLVLIAVFAMGSFKAQGIQKERATQDKEKKA